MSVFDKRVAFKPFEYPEVIKFKESIQHSYWLFSEWTFTSDIQDFNVKLNKVEKSVIKNTMLAIAQIEVAIKEFWGKIGNKFPKAEIQQVGAVFSESEVRHADAYSHLLEILGLNTEFDLLLQNPVIQGRVDYLQKYLKGAAENTDEAYTLTLTLFSLFIENVSLFSQFAIIKSFYKYKNLLKDIDNVVQATQKEEQVHALFGAYIVNLIKKEKPEWFNSEFYDKLYRACKKAYDAEAKIIDWIFQDGELDFLPANTLKEFIKERFNDSVEMIGGKKVFEVDRKVLKPLKWFTEEIHAQTNTDFWHQKPVNYTKKKQAIKAENLF